MKRHRPVFFNLIQIQMPVGALTSITHRITGVILAVVIPFGVYLFDVSLQSPESYSSVQGVFERLPVRGAAIVFIWALAHHSLAGIRHLLTDIDIGSELRAARRSAWIVNVSAIAVASLAAVSLL